MRFTSSIDLRTSFSSPPSSSSPDQRADSATAGSTYYYNEHTNQTTWTAPSDASGFRGPAVGPEVGVVASGLKVVTARVTVEGSEDTNGGFDQGRISAEVERSRLEEEGHRRGVAGKGVEGDREEDDVERLNGKVVMLERVVEEEKRTVARLEKEVVGLKSKMNIARSHVEKLKKQLADASSMLKKDVMAMNALSQSATPVSVRDVHQLSTDAHEKVCSLIYICMYACVCA
jgi:hypothetical protein